MTVVMTVTESVFCTNSIICMRMLRVTAHTYFTIFGKFSTTPHAISFQFFFIDFLRPRNKHKTSNLIENRKLLIEKELS